MRVAILFATTKSDGGIYQYALTLVHAIERLRQEVSHDDFVLLFPNPRQELPSSLRQRGWTVLPLSHPPTKGIGTVLRRLVGEGPHREAWRAFRRRWLRHQQPDAPTSGLASIRYRADLTSWWRQQGIELVIYPQPNPLAFEAGIPSIVAIHDLQHRLQPEFPEVSAYGEWGRREYVLRNCARHATTVLVDSELGKEQLLFFYGSYGVTADRVQVLPFLPASTLPRDLPATRQREIRSTYAIPERYVFYPAQFWPHKNHARIIEALERLKRFSGVRVPAVFCGSHADPVRKGHYQLLLNIARDCGVEDQITVLGYVPDEHLSALYSGAVALVMPTFFGPTNIPVLEAWALGCPVLTSDIPGIREQAGDAALLVDPRSADALANAMLRLWSSEELRKDLIERGKQRLSSYTPEHYRRRLREILADTEARSEPQRPPRPRV